MQELLDKVGLIDYKYEKLNEKEQFNIISLLMSKSDEVNLHSKVVCELLNPEGSHGKGNELAERFLKEIGIADFDLEGYEVSKEYRNIDILLTNEQQRYAIIIENKIWAGDQDRQLERYYKIAVEEGYKIVEVYYLTLFGDEPSDESIGDLKDNQDVKIQLLSYQDEISSWMEACIELCARNPTLREALVQYKAIVSELTGNTMGEDQKMEVLGLLSKGENALKARSIYENWPHYKWHTEWEFWNDLKDVASKEFKVLDRSLFNEDKISTMIHRSRNRNPWYGVMFNIGWYKGLDVRCFIERAFEPVYFGLVCFYDEDFIYVDKDENCTELRDKLKSRFAWETSQMWLGGDVLKPEIDFEKFSDPTTLKLLNDEFRKKYLKDNWVRIRKFVEECQTELQNIPTIK